MAPPEGTPPDWHGRMARCRKLADLLRDDTAGARLAALALEIEEELQRFSQLSAVAEEKRRHCAAIISEIDGILSRCRSELFFARHFLRDRAYSADDLREEARLCREEAVACEDIEARREFAHRAFELAMLGEAVSRKESDGQE